MNYFDFIVLYCLKRFNGERSISAVYHLLKGKKSAQTIQDGNLYQLISLFQTIKTLERKQLNESIMKLEDKEMIVPKHSTFVITSKGEETVNCFLKKEPFSPSLNGWVYGDVSEIFWNRLGLFLQSLSCMLAHKYNFLPVNRDYSVHLWVKRHFPKTNEERIQTAKNLYKEIENLLNTCDEQEAFLFTYRLSGYHRIGYTIEQLAQQLKLDPIKAHFSFQGLLHYMVSLIKKNSYKFPLLHLFITDQTINALTASAKQTYSLLEKGKTVEEIVKVRRLKRNTIEDHVVEIAMHDDSFVINEYVSLEKQAHIVKVLQKANTKRLKIIRERLGEHYSYFEIRLVLAREGIKL
ncbi:helix-turn-helix domain-containing protein [Bacillus taeanensis]|uniref:RQC domain-containing protein n=1 Tax=Bacillus taeanensis TaxID=273032 RepID=A0A366Y287_9BACI|nr:helix-turn-helix domain-containing protein [Bacillus taeanensis]RBW70321.1 RQC domain-containing protein [Bacillus taeanensis]